MHIKHIHTPVFVIRRSSLEKSSSRLTSTVKPLMELLPLEAVIDIKPDMDYDLIAEEPVEIAPSHGRTRGPPSRPTAEIYRPGQSKYSSVSSADSCRPSEGSSHYRQQDSRSSRSSRSGSSRVLWFHKIIQQLSVDKVGDECRLASIITMYCRLFFSRRSCHGSVRRL